MSTEIVIDLNVRDTNGVTYSGFEDVRGDMPRVGDLVIAREVEDDVFAEAIVTRICEERQLIYIAVAWSRLRDYAAPTPAEFERAVNGAKVTFS